MQKTSQSIHERYKNSLSRSERIVWACCGGFVDGEVFPLMHFWPDIGRMQCLGSQFGEGLGRAGLPKLRSGRAPRPDAR
jgi:hypothetical protein